MHVQFGSCMIPFRSCPEYFHNLGIEQRTGAVSNQLPRLRSDIASRYARSLVKASQTSATWTMRTPRNLIFSQTMGIAAAVGVFVVKFDNR